MISIRSPSERVPRSRNAFTLLLASALKALASLHSGWFFLARLKTIGDDQSFLKCYAKYFLLRTKIRNVKLSLQDNHNRIFNFIELSFSLQLTGYRDMKFILCA
jgi:hypothetical protein